MKMTLFPVIVINMFIILSCSRQPVYPAPAVSGTDVVIETTGLKSEIPQFFTYGYQGKNINFFVVRMDQKVISFLDACASCYPHRRGYRCDDGSVTCRICNMKFSLYKLEKGLGGCYPIKIEGRMENGRYLIPLAALEAEAGKF